MGEINRYEIVEISRHRLAELEACAEFLEALYTLGVDNWEGYDEACAMYEDDRTKPY